MEIKDRDRITMTKALIRYGIEKQTLMLCEECGELIQQANKTLRYGINTTLDSLTEEIADVLIMISQIRLYYGIQWSEVDKVVDEKIQRLAKRMETGK